MLRITIALAVLIASVPVGAQEPGSLRAKIHPDEKSCLLTTPLEVHEFQVVTSDLGAELLGYEFYLDVDPNVSVTSYTLVHPDPVNVGVYPNFIVGLSACAPGDGLLELVRVEYMVFMARSEAMPIYVGPVVPSSFPTKPHYFTCDEKLFPFTGSDYVPNHCKDIFTAVPPDFDLETCTATGLATSARSWGILKASY